MSSSLFSNGDWVEWIDPPQNPEHCAAVKDLIAKYGLGPFKVVKVRDDYPHPTGGQFLSLQIREDLHISHSSWYKKCDEKAEEKLLRKIPEGAEVYFQTQYGDTRRNAHKAVVLEHLPGQSGGFAHLIKFELDGKMEYVYAQELIVSI